MANILCVLYDDPVDGYPPQYPLDEVPKIESYFDGSSTPTPEGLDFTPGDLLGCVSGELGLRSFLEEGGNNLTVTSDKDGPDSEFERRLPEAEVVISQPFWPAYLTAERIAKAPNPETGDHGRDRLGSRRSPGGDGQRDHSRGGHLLQQHQRLRARGDDDPGAGPQLHPSYQTVIEDGWNIADCVSRSYDVEGMQVGTVGAGRIGSAVLRRMKPFEVGLHYTDRHRLPDDEKDLGVTFHESTEAMIPVCDVVTINAPLHPETEGLFDEEMLGRMKRGAYIVNTARGKICDRDAIVRALESGQLAGYAGDVWFPQPAPRDHPWRSMPHHGMTPHVSGTSLSAQARYAAGTREILECWLEGRPIREEYLIVDAGALAGAGAPTAPAMPQAARRRRRNSASGRAFLLGPRGAARSFPAAR